MISFFRITAGVDEWIEDFSALASIFCTFGQQNKDTNLVWHLQKKKKRFQPSRGKLKGHIIKKLTFHHLPPHGCTEFPTLFHCSCCSLCFWPSRVLWGLCTVWSFLHWVCSVAPSVTQAVETTPTLSGTTA